MTNTDKKENNTTEIRTLAYPYLLDYNMSEEEFKHYTIQVTKGNIPAMLMHIIHNQAVMFRRIKEILKKVEDKNK